MPNKCSSELQEVLTNDDLSSEIRASGVDPHLIGDVRIVGWNQM